MRGSVRATKWSSVEVPALTGVTRYEVRVLVRKPFPAPGREDGLGRAQQQPPAEFNYSWRM